MILSPRMHQVFCLLRHLRVNVHDLDKYTLIRRPCICFEGCSSDPTLGLYISNEVLVHISLASVPFTPSYPKDCGLTQCCLHIHRELHLKAFSTSLQANDFGRTLATALSTSLA